MAIIKTIHHINLRPSKNDYDATIKFYCEDLGMKMINSWTKLRGDFNSRNCFIDAGNGVLIEICESAVENKSQGIIQHYALYTDDATAILQSLKDKGYEICDSKGNVSENLTIDIEIGDPVIKSRLGFVKSPSGELVEIIEDL